MCHPTFSVIRSESKLPRRELPRRAGRGRTRSAHLPVPLGRQAPHPNQARSLIRSSIYWQCPRSRLSHAAVVPRVTPASHPGSHLSFHAYTSFPLQIPPVPPKGIHNGLRARLSIANGRTARIMIHAIGSVGLTYCAGDMFHNNAEQGWSKG